MWIDSKGLPDWVPKALEKTEVVWEGLQVRRGASTRMSKDEAKWQSLCNSPKEWTDCRVAKQKGMVSAMYPDFKNMDGETALWAVSRGTPTWVIDEFASGARSGWRQYGQT